MIGRVRQKIHIFYMHLPYSDAPFMKAYPSETTEAFLDGHVSAHGVDNDLVRKRPPRTTAHGA